MQGASSYEKPTAGPAVNAHVHCFSSLTRTPSPLVSESAPPEWPPPGPSPRWFYPGVRTRACPTDLSAPPSSPSRSCSPRPGSVVVYRREEGGGEGGRERKKKNKGKTKDGVCMERWDV